MVKRLKYLVGGEWKDTTSGSYYEITNSSTGEVMAEAPRCTAEEVDAAVEAAAAAFPAWRDTSTIYPCCLPPRWARHTAKLVVMC